jgi:hypothetical protein
VPRKKSGNPAYIFSTSWPLFSFNQRNVNAYGNLAAIRTHDIQFLRRRRYHYTTPPGCFVSVTHTLLAFKKKLLPGGLHTYVCIYIPNLGTLIRTFSKETKR